MKRSIIAWAGIVLWMLLMPLVMAGMDQERWFNGFARPIKGEHLEYHSPDPDVRSSLLVRSEDALRFIEWESEAIPEGFSDPEAHFIWLFGIAVRQAGHLFTLSLNGLPLVTFTNPPESEKKGWSVEGKDGAILRFEPTLVDRYNDLMGYAVLTVPRKRLQPGKFQIIRVSGESSGNRDWYMTFLADEIEKTRIIQENCIIQDKGSLFHSLQLRYFRCGPPLQGRVSVVNGPSQDFIYSPGFNCVRILIPKRKKTEGVTLHISVQGRSDESVKKTVRSIKPWLVYLVQHAHTDIGYTRPQTDILPEHLRYIDYALDLCDQTDSYPDDARFRWTCETSWAVREYLRSRPPEQVARLLKRIKEGRIEVTALFLNMSDICDESSLVDMLKPIRLFGKNGIAVKTAMQNDVNGVGWGLVDYLHSLGVKYLVMGQNSHRALKPFALPTLFWWQSPSGCRILVWCADHYMTGNFLGIHGRDFELVERELPAYLDRLEEKGYADDRTSIQYSGYYTDNSPPSSTACDLVKRWNERYASPHLRLATAQEFLNDASNRHGGALSVQRGAWPDWWTDGFGAAALETAFARRAHVELLAGEALLAMARLLGSVVPDSILRRMDDVREKLLFFDEHTWGAAESITDPSAENSVVQLAEKASYGWEAVKGVRQSWEDGMGLIQPFLARSRVPTLVLFNTLNWVRDGLTEVYIDHQILSRDGKVRILDEGGSELPVQMLWSREEGSCWLVHVRDLPPFGFKRFRIEALGPAEIMPASFSGVLENRFYRVEIDETKGCIRSLYDKELARDLISGHAPWSLGEVIYERLGNDRRQLELFKLETFSRQGWKNVRVIGSSNGPVWQGVVLNGDLPECADGRGVNCEIRLYHDEKRIEFSYSMRKLPVLQPEGAYVAFPFELKGGRFFIEVQGGQAEFGVEQLAGSAHDWVGVQNFVSIRADNGQIVLVSPEIPLVQLGGMNLGQFRRTYHPDNSHIYSWVLNNYWTTNFKAFQEGELHWTYHLTSSPDSSPGYASRFGWGVRMPILTRVMPAALTEDAEKSRSLLSFTTINPLLVSARLQRDDGDEQILMHLREVEGESVSISIKDWISQEGQISAIYECNALGEGWKNAADAIFFKPGEAKFLILGMKKSAASSREGK